MAADPVSNRVAPQAGQAAVAEVPGRKGAGSPAGGPRTKWLILTVACLAQLMVVLDGSIVNIALPSAQADIGFSTGNRQWVVTGYALAYGSFLLVGGRLGDLVGRRGTFLVGLAGFAAASALGGTAGSFGLLLVARASQGVFGALLAPSALSLLATTFTDPRERGRAFAVYGAIAGGGFAIGVILGGVLTEYLSWRWCLYVNVPIAAVALAGGLLLVPRTARDSSATLDVPGAVLSITGLVGVVYGLAHAETDGWSSAPTVGFVAAGAVLLCVFVLVETRVADPLLPMAILTDRSRGGAYVSLAVLGTGMFGVFLFLTYYLSTVLGYTALTTGLAFLPMIGGVMAAAQLVRKAVERVGVKVPVAAGFLIAASGLALLSRLTLDSSYVTDILPGLVLNGFGVGCVMTPCINAATDRVDPRHVGVASAAVSTCQQIGGSIGTAVLSAVAASAAADYLHGRDGADPAVAANASLESYTAAFLVSAFLFTGGAVISAFLLRHGPPPRQPNTAPATATP